VQPVQERDVTAVPRSRSCGCPWGKA